MLRVAVVLHAPSVNGIGNRPSDRTSRVRFAFSFENKSEQYYTPPTSVRVAEMSAEDVLFDMLHSEIVSYLVSKSAEVNYPFLNDIVERIVYD